MLLLSPLLVPGLKLCTPWAQRKRIQLSKTLRLPQGCSFSFLPLACMGGRNDERLSPKLLFLLHFLPILPQGAESNWWEINSLLGFMHIVVHLWFCAEIPLSGGRGPCFLFLFCFVLFLFPQSYKLNWISVEVLWHYWELHKPHCILWDP